MRSENGSMKEKKDGRRDRPAAPPETVTVRMLELPLFRRMTEAARLLRELADDPEKIEVAVESDSNYGRVSLETDYRCWSGRELEIFQRALSLATELVVCAMEDETFVLELSFPGVFSSYELRSGTENRNADGQKERSM